MPPIDGARIPPMLDPPKLRIAGLENPPICIPPIPPIWPPLKPPICIPPPPKPPMCRHPCDPRQIPRRGRRHRGRLLRRDHRHVRMPRKPSKRLKRNAAINLTCRFIFPPPNREPDRTGQRRTFTDLVRFGNRFRLWNLPSCRRHQFIRQQINSKGSRSGGNDNFVMSVLTGP